MSGDGEARSARRLRIDGRVQGVGFRYALAAKAKSLGLCGWVRNRSDGSVEALVCGTRASVDALTAWAHQGPPSARVERVVTADDSGSDCGSGFSQRATL